MTTTTNYALNIVEGTDIVNPLTQFNPNFNTIDGVMKDNADAAVSPATCIKTGTVHTITRTNTDSEMFVFTATGDWNTGDTMTVDGLSVTPVLPDGTALLSGSYLINGEVLCSIKGTKVTVYSNKYNIGADIVDNLTSTATDKALSANQGKALNDKAELIRIKTKTVSVTPIDNAYVTPFTKAATISYDSDVTQNTFLSASSSLTASYIIMAYPSYIVFACNTAGTYDVTIKYSEGVQ